MFKTSIFKQFMLNVSNSIIKNSQTSPKIDQINTGWNSRFENCLSGSRSKSKFTIPERQRLVCWNTLLSKSRIFMQWFGKWFLQFSGLEENVSWQDKVSFQSNNTPVHCKYLQPNYSSTTTKRMYSGFC